MLDFHAKCNAVTYFPLYYKMFHCKENTCFYLTLIDIPFVVEFTKSSGCFCLGSIYALCVRNIMNIT